MLPSCYSCRFFSNRLRRLQLVRDIPVTVAVAVVMSNNDSTNSTLNGENVNVGGGGGGGTTTSAPTVSPPGANDNNNGDDSSTLLNLPIIDYEASGFFTVADLGELATLIDAGQVRQEDIQTFVLQDGGGGGNNSDLDTSLDGGTCPAGLICDGQGRAANCTKVRMVPVIMGFGDILAGTYCPENDWQLQNCPVGSYCETAPTDPQPCPKGFYCPHKTAIPEIECDMCGAAQEQIKRDFYGFTVIYFLVVVALIYCVTRLVRTYRRETYDKIVTLTSQQMDAMRLTKLRQAEQERLEKVKPMLQRIMEGVPGGNAENASLGGTSADGSARSGSRGGASRQPISFGSDGRIQYHARQLFAALDTDQDGYLGYDELQGILRLRPEQLQFFVRRLHELEGSDSRSAPQRAVSKSCFVRYFLSVLQETCNAAPTQQEAAVLFDQIDKGRTGVIFTNVLFSSPISYFLSDPQINQLIKGFRRRLQEDENGGGERGENSAYQSSFFQTAVAHADPFSAFGRRSRSTMLTKDFFTKFYPTVLHEVMNAPEEVPSSMPNGATSGDPEQANMNSGKRTQGTVDITFENLSLTVTAGETQSNVVNQCSGRVKAGALTVGV